jgi:hypothetical protein
MWTGICFRYVKIFLNFHWSVWFRFRIQLFAVQNDNQKLLKAFGGLKKNKGTSLNSCKFLLYFFKTKQTKQNNPETFFAYLI